MAQLFGLGGKSDGGDGTGAGLPEDVIKDATAETFQQDVLAASREAPVIVDFWAEWCGPCKQLGPALEKHVAAQNGRVRLVKVDIDKNQLLAQQMRIQSIPAVYAFVNGQPVDGFMGAVPESEVKAFVDALVQMAGGGAPGLEEFLDAADAAFDAGDVAGAARAYGEVARAESGNVRALAGLARCHVATRNFEEARRMLDLIPPEKRDDPSAAAVAAALKLAETEGEAGDAAELRAKVEADPSDHQARYDLAGALAAEGDMEGAMDHLLNIIENDRGWNDDAARKKLLTLFDALGPKSPLVASGRRKLSSILFS